MPKYLKYTLLALLWGGVAAYLLYAGGKVRRHCAEQPVTRIEVEVVDSTSQLRLVSEATVRGWLARSGIKTVGEKIGAVRLDALERLAVFAESGSAAAGIRLFPEKGYEQPLIRKGGTTCRKRKPLR